MAVVYCIFLKKRETAGLVERSHDFQEIVWYFYRLLLPGNTSLETESVNKLF